MGGSSYSEAAVANMVPPHLDAFHKEFPGIVIDIRLILVRLLTIQFGHIKAQEIGAVSNQPC